MHKIVYISNKNAVNPDNVTSVREFTSEGETWVEVKLIDGSRIDVKLPMRQIMSALNSLRA